MFRVEVLQNEGFQVLFPRSKPEAVAAIEEGGFELVLVSYSLSNETAQELVELARQKSPRCTIISISETGWDDLKIRPDATILAESGPRGMMEAIRNACDKRLRRIK